MAGLAGHAMPTSADAYTFKPLPPVGHGLPLGIVCVLIFDPLRSASMPTTPDTRLRGDAADHTDADTTGSTDAELHLDDEKDTLYEDGLDVEDDSETLADTKGNAHRG
jgi:hypothetical protein